VGLEQPTLDPANDGTEIDLAIAGDIASGKSLFIHNLKY
jgi:hypothetical protein